MFSVTSFSSHFQSSFAFSAHSLVSQNRLVCFLPFHLRSVVHRRPVRGRYARGAALRRRVLLSFILSPPCRKMVVILNLRGSKIDEFFYHFLYGSNLQFPFDFSNTHNVNAIFFTFASRRDVLCALLDFNGKKPTHNTFTHPHTRMIFLLQIRLILPQFKFMWRYPIVVFAGLISSLMP